MQSLKLLFNDDKLKDDSDLPKLYLLIRLNYFSCVQFCDRTKRTEIQRLYNWLNKSRKLFSILPAGDLLGKKPDENDQKLLKLSKRYEHLKNLSKLNFNKDLKSYIYGHPSKKDLDQMQVQLRTYTGNRYLLLKVNETISANRDQKVRINSAADQPKIKKNELVVNVDILFMIFKRLQTSKLADASNDNFVLELTGYRFKIILIIIYALYTNQLYLTLNTLPEIVQISLDLGIEQVLKFINKLILKDDPIYLLFKLRNYLSLLSGASFTQQMTYMLRQTVTNYDKLINYPGILDLNFNEINFLVWKKESIFKTFNLNAVVRNEFQVLRAILDWYMIDRMNRDEQCISLLNKVDYANLSFEQLDKLVNYFLLNNYSDDVKRYLKNKFSDEFRRRRESSSIFFQEMPRSRIEDESLRIECISTPKPIESLSEKMSTTLKTTTKPDLDQEDADHETKELFNDYFKNLIHLGTYSLIASSSPIYSINEKSIMLLLGGFKSHVPYPKDQGKLMYHLIKTQLDSTAQAVSIPTILTHDWFPLQERLPRNLGHFATIRILNCIFILGGLDLNYLLLNNERKQVKPISNCYVLNLTTNSWYKIKSMNLNRAFHCAVKHENLIYVFGGLTYYSSTNSLTVNNTMEFYDLTKNLWFLVYDPQSTLGVALPCPRYGYFLEILNAFSICLANFVLRVEWHSAWSY